MGSAEGRQAGSCAEPIPAVDVCSDCEALWFSVSTLFDRALAAGRPIDSMGAGFLPGSPGELDARACDDPVRANEIMGGGIYIPESQGRADWRIYAEGFGGSTLSISALDADNQIFQQYWFYLSEPGGQDELSLD